MAGQGDSYTVYPYSFLGQGDETNCWAGRVIWRLLRGIGLIERRAMVFC